MLCMLLDVKSLVTKGEYTFLIDYFSFTKKEMCDRYKLSEPTIRKRANNLIARLRESHFG